MVLMQGGGNLLAQCKNTLWMILEAEENSSKPATPPPKWLDSDGEGDGDEISFMSDGTITPPPIPGLSCTAGGGSMCKDCNCKVVFKKCKGE